MKKIIACVTLVFVLAFGIYALTCIEKAEAEGRAESMRKIADAEAYSITKKVEAQYTANKKLAESLTPELIRYIMATGWNGVLPKVTGENIPMLNIPLE
jgi:hypothetical protein